MTDTAGPFDGSPWAEAQWARHAAAWAPSGVYGTPAASTTTGDLPLSVSGLSVGLGAGRAWVRGLGFERTGAAVMQAVTANTHASFSRRDRIVLRRNLATHTITPVLLTGTPAASPTAPAITQNEAGSWDLPMFSFLVPPNSGTSITGIVDERAWIDPGGEGRIHRRSMLIERASGLPTDTYGAGRTSLLGGTWVAAPAGDYLVHATLAVNSASNVAAEVFIVANGTTITKTGTRADTPVGVVGVLSYTRPYTHTGGDLTVSLDHHPNASVTVNNATTQMVVEHLGRGA